MMSAGVILAWATEAQEKGIISDTEAMGIKLDWGNYAAYIDAVRLIIERPNEFYKALARGVLYAVSIYGGAEYALAWGKRDARMPYRTWSTYMGVDWCKTLSSGQCWLQC
ncbi:MAG: aldehyde ferredoxin oxidoreductase C-terminal domain-containing protein [Candidatus Methanogasteraceae archaeon]